MITPKEHIERRRRRIKHACGNAAVLVCTLAGVMCADPWQTYRAGGVPEFIAPANILELIFSIILGLVIILGVQEVDGNVRCGSIKNF